MRYPSLLVTLVLVGCPSENDFGDALPDWPASIVPPLPVETQTDVPLQVTTPQVDILWMVDNSCSMFNEQSDLTANFPFFMDFFVGSGLDYHVGVTSSDTISTNYSGSDGTLVMKNGIKFIDPNTPNPIGQFSLMATLGTTGRFPERGIDATYKALEEKRDTANAGFYRDDAAIHTIIISDEPDYTQDFVIELDEYINWYDGLKTNTEDRTFSAIIDPNRGARYEQVATNIGGIVWSLTSENWPQVLELLGLQAAGLRREYFLSQRPVAETIEVEVEDVGGALLKFEEAVFDPDGNYLSGDWTYDSNRNSITFIEYVPNALSKVVLRYSLLAAQVD